MATKITTPELFNLSSNNTAATQLPVFTTSTRPTPTTSTVTVDYLVVGGGGGTYAGGGANYIGGGGAGGLRTSYGSTSGGGAVAEPGISLSTAKSYAITVGPASLDGEDSVFGSITSLGGGRSGATASTAAGSSGGSGGGASGNAYNAAGGSGTANQGYSGGNSGPSCSGGSCRYPGGGGGGAASAGANATTTTAGNGGNGLEVNIIGGTGNYYAGGGGGSSYLSGAGTGGLGGGGNGSASYSGSEVVNNGATNTGGGGGGGLMASSTPALGGSGIVILRYPTSSSLNIITTGSLVYTESTDGSDTILQFTEGSGNFGFAANNIAIGEMIFNSTTGKVEYWDGFQWNMIKDEPVLNIDIFNDNSCIAYYRFNGNANDETGNYNATASNETYSATGGKEGGYISLPQNSSGIINTNDSGALAPGGTNVRSYSIWVKFQETGQADTIWSQWRSNPTPRSTAFWIINRSDGKIEVVNYRSNSSSDYRRTLTTSTFTALNSWYNIVVSIGQSNAVTIWVNGTQAATTGSGNIGTINNITNPNTTIGSLSNPNTGTYGIFDEARVFNRALTNAEALILSNEF